MENFEIISKSGVIIPKNGPDLSSTLSHRRALISIFSNRRYFLSTNLKTPVSGWLFSDAGVSRSRYWPSVAIFENFWRFSGCFQRVPPDEEPRTVRSSYVGWVSGSRAPGSAFWRPRQGPNSYFEHLALRIL